MKTTNYKTIKEEVRVLQLGITNLGMDEYSSQSFIENAIVTTQKIASCINRLPKEIAYELLNILNEIFYKMNCYIGIQLTAKCLQMLVKIN